jgi:hypothetical protein
MINALIAVALFLTALAVAVPLTLSLVNDLQKFAFRSGYEKGRRDGDKWWTEAEVQANESLRAIWREAVKGGDEPWGDRWP